MIKAQDTTYVAHIDSPINVNDRLDSPPPPRHLNPVAPQLCTRRTKSCYICVERQAIVRSCYPPSNKIFRTDGCMWVRTNQLPIRRIEGGYVLTKRALSKS